MERAEVAAMPPARERSKKVSLAVSVLVVLGLRLAMAEAAEVATPATPQSTPPNAPNPLGIQVRAITLGDALAYARAHQPAVRAALARIAEQKAVADVPRAQWRPFAGVTGQMFEGTANNTTASYVSTDVVDIPRIGGTHSADSRTAKWKPSPSTLAAVGGNQEVFDFGRIAAQSAAADALVVVAEHASDVVRLDIELGVEEAYFAVTAARSILRAAEDAYQRASVHRDFAKAGVHSGLRSPIELTRAEADLTRFDTGRIQARGGLATAQTVLAAAVGIPEPALDAAETTLTPRDLPALADALRQAEGREPRIQETLARLRAQEQQTRAISALLRPDLQLTATFSGRAGGASPSNAADPIPSGSGYLPNVPNWDAGLVFVWPLLDPTVNARATASKAAEQVRREEIDLARQQLVANVEQAYVAVDVARQALPSLQRELEAARANYAQADARFKAGLGTSVELADAEALRTDAEIRLALGVFDLAKARAAFGRAIAESL
jgi:outer membrane protein TolC